MSEKKELKKEIGNKEVLENVSGGFVKVTEFFFTLTYTDSNGKNGTGSISASGTNRASAKPLAETKAKDWCNSNNCTFVSLA